MKKTLCLILILILMLGITVSCTPASSEVSKTESQDAVSAENSEVEEEFVLFGNLPEKDYGNTTFTILVEGDYNGERYKSIEIIPDEKSSKIISDAVAARNDLVEERFRIKIEEIRTASTAQMLSYVRLNASSGDNAYDLIMPFLPDAATMAAEKLLYPLSDSSILDLKKDYWDQSAVKDLSINNTLYFCPSDINMLALNCTDCIIFNKDLIKQHGLEDPYKLVDNNEWTLDKMYSMAKDVTMLEGEMDLDSTWGLLTNDRIATSFYIGAGQRLTQKNSSDGLELAIRGDYQATVFDKIFEIYNDDRVGVIEDYNGKYPDIYAKATESVAKNNTLFRTMVIVDINEMGDYKCDFGIIPIPKFSEDQDKYYSYVSVVLANCCAIPAQCRDLEMSQIILEAMAQASTDTVRKEYYKTTLQTRKLQDDEGERMLDLVFDGRVYDYGAIYNWGGAHKWDDNGIARFLAKICKSKKNTYGSDFDRYYDTFETALDSTMENFK